MKSSVPQGPTIPSSTNYISNFTRLLKITESIEGSSFRSPNPATPGIDTVLSGGTLSGLNDPVLDSQGATYAYVLSHGGASNPGGPVTAVQYNDSGSFGGSTSLTFNGSVLTANKISNGTVNIGSNTISGLSDPVLDQEAATKNYVDNYTAINISTVNTVGATTYTAASVVNGLIYRDTQTSGSVTDTLPTAAQIIAESGATVGTTITFSIKNISSDLSNVFNFSPGLGITTGFPINIYSGYQYNGIMIVTNTDLGTEAITLYYLNSGRTNTTNWEVELGGAASIVNVFQVTDYLMVYNSVSEFTPISKIRPDDVTNKIIKVNPSGPDTVTIDSPDVFMGIFPMSEVITSPFIWTTGGMDFYIMNTSTVPGADLTFTGTTGVVPWTFDLNSNMLIPPGHTGWFMVVLEVTNYPQRTSLLSATLYSLGIFPSS